MNNYCPHHYCSICNADSLYAPQPNGSFPKIHSYLCGSTQLYLESGTQVFTGHGQQVTFYTKIPGDFIPRGSAPDGTQILEKDPSPWA